MNPFHHPNEAGHALAQRKLERGPGDLGPIYNSTAEFRLRALLPEDRDHFKLGAGGEGRGPRKAAIKYSSTPATHPASPPQNRGQ